MAVAAAGLVGTPAAAVAPTADRVFQLGTPGFGAMLVDAVHDQLLISAGSTGTTVLVRDHDGDAVTSLTGLAGPTALALSPDAALLFVLQAGSRSIAGFDTATWTSRGQVSLGTTTCATTLTAGLDRLWFGHACGSNPAGLGNVDVTGLASGGDLSSASVSLGAMPADVTITGSPRVAASPTDPTTLVLSASDSPQAQLYVLDTASGTPTVRAYRRADHLTIDPIRDAAFTADGGSISTGTGLFFRASDLAADGAYQREVPHDATAVSGDGLVVARTAWEYGLDLYTRGGTRYRTLTTYASGDPYGDHVRGQLGGLAFTASGDWLFVISGSGPPNYPVRLIAIREPAKRSSAVTITAPVTVALDSTMVVKGRLVGVDTAATAQSVRVRRSSDFGSPADIVLPVAADGTWSLNQTFRQRGAHRYVVTWAGDATHAASESATVVTVKGLSPGLIIRLGTQADQLVYSRPVTVTVLLGATHTSRSVQVQKLPWGVKTPITIGGGTVNSSGSFTMRAYPGFPGGSYQAYFAGDGRYVPKRTGINVLVGALVDSRLFDQYTTSGNYAVYHLKTNPVFGIAPWPLMAGCIAEFVIEKYSSTQGWQYFGAGQSRTFTSEGAAFIQFGLPRKVGERYRIYGFTMNNGEWRNSYSSLRYFTFTS